MKMVHVISCIMVFSVFAFGQQSPHGLLKEECSACHGTASWKELAQPMRFNHSTTAYPLRGQHQSAECIDCHTTLRFAGTLKNCYSCHQKEFQSTAQPNHVRAGFSTECERCHSIDAQSWRNSFDHNKVDFPLRGAHEGVACTQCHLNETFRGVPVQCYVCHQQEYLATTDPNHQTAKFPTNCETCHRALTWKPASLFPHESYFPISSGSTHRPGRWNNCGDCHTNSANYAQFECINCHEHNKSSMDKEHLGEVSGYVYQSSACYRCHPRGEED
ncbi:MAG: hypothetical protein WDA22_14930 [Bacteroidota bacterium]